jgi:AAA+ superfamily predicted ATPase
MFPELAFHLRAVTRLIYFVTEEEDRFLLQLQAAMRDKAAHVKVYNAAFGLIPLANLISDWSSKQHTTDNGTMSIHDALIAIYKEPTPKERKFYIITDPDRWLKDAHVQRRILNILHQVHNDVGTVKVLICVGSQRYVPEKLTRYMEVVQDTGLSNDEILEVVEGTCKPLKMDTPENIDTLFKGLTSFEIQAALIQSYKKAQGRADSSLLSAYRFKQLRKTDLVQYIDSSRYTFDQIGGIGRFKTWAHRTTAAWTPEGRKFGLEPPRGVLAIGVWGTGKSLSIKALSNTWGLPIVQFDLGRLRQSGVGDSESNLYAALRLIEASAPCLIFVDEAEKNLAGAQSSAYSDAGTTSRMIGILSTWLQETMAPICMVMTANSLKTLPVELINRADERWFFDLPSLEDRIDIIKIHLRQRNQDPDNFNLVRLAEAAESMVGREIEQCLKAAMIESYEQKKFSLDENIFVSNLEHKPRIVRTMADDIKEILDWIGFDPSANDGIRARFASVPVGQDRKLKVISV